MGHLQRDCCQWPRIHKLVAPQILSPSIKSVFNYYHLGSSLVYAVLRTYRKLALLDVGRSGHSAR